MLTRLAKILAGLLLIVLGLLFLLYSILPDLTSRLLVRLLVLRGFDQVVVQVDRPGLTSLHIPNLSVHKVLGSEHLRLALEDVQVEYDLRELLRGRLGTVVVPRASIVLQDARGSSDPADVPEPPTLAFGTLFQPIPKLPLAQLFLDQVTVHRDRASGPFRDMTISGTIQEHAQVLTGALTFKGLQGSAYQLRWMGRHAGAMTVELHRLGRQGSPVVSFRSEQLPSDSDLHLRGTFQTEFQELAPLLALLVPLGPQIEQISGTVSAEWSGTASRSTTMQSLWLDPATKVEGNVQVRLSLPEWPGLAQTVALLLSGQISGNGHRLDWTLNQDSLFGANVSLATFKMPGWLAASFTRSFAPLTIDLPSGAHGHLIPSAESPSWAMEGPVRARYGNATTPMRAELIATTLAQSPIQDLSGRGKVRLAGKARPVAQDAVQVAEATWDVVGEATVEAARAQVQLDRTSMVKVSRVRTAQVRVPSVILNVAEPLHLLVDLPSRHWVIDHGRVRLRVPSFTVKETRLTLDRADLGIKRLEPVETGWNADLSLAVTRLAPSMTTLALPSSDWQIHVATEPSMIMAEVEGKTSNNLISMTGSGTQRWSEKQGSARLHLGPLRFEPSQAVLSALATPWPYPFDIVGGEASSDIEVVWTGDPRLTDEAPIIQRATVTLALNQLDGRYRNYDIRGLSTNATVHLKGTESLTMPEPARVGVASVKGPVEVTRLSCEVQVGWTDPSTIAWVDLRHLRAGLFGGQIVSDGLRYEPIQPTHRLTLQLQDFDVQQLLSLEQQKGLEGTGILDGTLPMVISGKTVVVEDGIVEARPPGGVIRYRPPAVAGQAVASTNPQMEMVLQALSDFHYNVLTMSVQYREAGNLSLNTRLEGRNPGWQNGRPVHFNLNVQENIPALLKTLDTVTRVQDALTERLEGEGGSSGQTEGGANRGAPGSDEAEGER
ncbi:MAG: YdbH domain-containing protein [Nitrospiraceae bacterium]